MHAEGSFMKTCPCGGAWHRHGLPQDGDGMRYRCKVCRKCITVRDGQIVNPAAKRIRKDWRHE